MIRDIIIIVKIQEIKVMRNIYETIANEECKQAVLFARVSSEEQKRGASIDAQISTIENYCKKKGLKILKPYFTIVESSTRGGRKKFHEMLKFVKRQKHKTAIVVNCVDRLQRGYKECVELDELRNQGRIELHFYKESLLIHKDSSSSDTMRWDMGILSAKMYVCSLKDNVRRSQKYKREHGQFLSIAPVGYQNISKTDHSSADIVIDPIRAPKVKMLFEEYAKGNRTLQDMAVFAKNINLSSRTTKSGKTLSRAQIQKILKNPFYIGYFEYRGEKFNHNYETFIDNDLFRLVQKTMFGRKRAPSKLYYGEKQYMFTGLIRCGCCGSMMTCETKVKDENHKYIYLKCNKLRSKCHQKPVNEQTIIKQLQKDLNLPMVLNDTMKKCIKDLVKQQLNEENKNTSQLKKVITEKLQNLKNKEDRLFDAYIDGKCDEKTYKEKKYEISEERDRLIADMNKYLSIDEETAHMLTKMAEITANIGVFLKSPITSLKKDILNIILSDCVLNEKNLVFSIVKPFDELLKTPDFKKWCR